MSSTFIDADGTEIKGKESTEELVEGIIGEMNEPSEMADAIIAESPNHQLDASPSDPTKIWADSVAPSPQPTPVTGDLWGTSPVTPLTDGYQDVAGTLFDSNLHATDENGKPKKKADGTWAKKRGRKAGSVSSTAQAAPGLGASNGAALQAQNEIAALNSAIVTVQTIFLLGKAIGAEEWEPLPHEPGMLQDAWKNYYLTAGVTQLPPWLGVAIATGAYALPRTQRPKTKKRLFGAWVWLKHMGRGFLGMFY